MAWTSLASMTLTVTGMSRDASQLCNRVNLFCRATSDDGGHEEYWHGEQRHHKRPHWSVTRNAQSSDRIIVSRQKLGV
jgi:hypothetical protein